MGEIVAVSLLRRVFAKIPSCYAAHAELPVATAILAWGESSAVSGNQTGEAV
jgi:hypothetical protein